MREPVFKPNPNHCLNCGEKLRGTFCHKCGQSASTRRISFREVFLNFLSSAYSYNGAFVKTCSALFTNPGKVFVAYIQGQRQVYYNPIAYFVLITLVYFIVQSFINYDPIKIFYSEADSQEISPLVRDVIYFVVSHFNNILFLMVFSIAIVLKLFLGKRYNLAESMVIGFYTVSTYTLVNIFIILLLRYKVVSFKSFQTLCLVGVLMFNVVSLYKKYNVRTFVKACMITIGVILLYVPLAIFTALFFVLIF